MIELTRVIFVFLNSTRKRWLLAGLMTFGSATQAEDVNSTMTKAAISTEALIEALNLEQHVEGGYYRRTYQSDHRDMVNTSGGERFLLTSIYYLLTNTSPIGHWHKNQSDILHFFHLGAPITYYLIHPDGSLETVVMGSDPTKGQQLQLLVKGGTWKASYLPQGEFGLISEAVSPGFDFADMQLGSRQVLLEQFPQHKELIQQFTREK